MGVQDEIMKSYRRLGENVRNFRMVKRMSQSKLATIAHVSPAYISQIERMDLTKGITCTAIIKIAQALEIPACILMAEQACPDYQKNLSDLAIQSFQEEPSKIVPVTSRRKQNQTNPNLQDELQEQSNE